MPHAQRRPRNRALGYWIPIVASVTAVAAGLFLWAWSSTDDGGSDNRNRNEEQHRTAEQAINRTDGTVEDLIEEQRDRKAPGLHEELDIDQQDSFKSALEGAGESASKTVVTKPPSQRRSFAIVLAADSSEDDRDYLTWISRDFLESRSLRLFILIYAPYLTLEQRQEGYASATSSFKKLYDMSLSIVGDSTLVMPFSTINGYAHMLRHLPLTLAYIQEDMVGNDAAAMIQLLRWIRRVVVIAPDVYDPKKSPDWYPNPSISSSGRFHVAPRSLLATDIETWLSSH